MWDCSELGLQRSVELCHAVSGTVRAVHEPACNEGAEAFLNWRRGKQLQMIRDRTFAPSCDVAAKDVSVSKQ